MTHVLKLINLPMEISGNTIEMSTNTTLLPRLLCSDRDGSKEQNFKGGNLEECCEVWVNC